MNKGISRRDLFKFGGVAAVGAAGAAALGGCSPKAVGSSAKEEAASTVLEGYCAPDGGWLGSAPDVKATSTVDCDVLVAGSGHAGIQAALAAAEGGAKVVVIDLVTEENRKVKGKDIGHVNSQWLIDQGYGPYNVGEVTAEFVKRTAGRVNPEIIRKFVANSGEMFDHTAALVQWPDSRIKVTETADPSISPLDPSQCICQVPGIAADGPVEYPIVRGDYKSWAAVAQFMGPIQHEEFPGVAAFSRLDEFQQFAILKAQDLGAEWHYETSAVKLVQESEGGKVTGLVAKKADGSYVQYNTKIGVILCTGDYAANVDMVYNLNTEISEWVLRNGETKDDLKGFSTCDGIGQRMACWAGGEMEPSPRPVMVNGGGGDGPWGTTPYLWLNNDGKRYMNEAQIPAAWPATLRQPKGIICTVTDADWYETMKNAGLDHGAPNYGRPVYYEELIDDMNNVPVGSKEGGKCRTCTIAERMMSTVYAANTLDELADLAGYTGEAKQNFLKTIEEYNKMCEAGEDTQYGKDALFMKAIKTPPFYACPTKNERRVNAGLVTLAGVTCNENLEVMNASTDEPIGGLWAAGNCLGGRYGTGYATPFAGNSIGMAMTHGRVAGKLATGQAVL